MEEIRVKEDMDIDEENGVIVVKVKEEEATMTIQLIKRQVIIQPGVVEEESRKKEATMLEVMR